MATKIQLRRGLSSEWVTTNPTLSSGEAGFETDTGKFKIGTGLALWNDLPYGGAGGIEVFADAADRDTENPTPEHGDFAFLLDTNATQFYDGVGWQVLSAAKGGGSDKVFLEHEFTANNSYTIANNHNVISAGPIIVADGAIITVPDGSSWVVV